MVSFSISFFLTTLLTLLTLLSTVAALPVDVEHSKTKSKTYKGRGTWFNVGLGSCGETNADSDLIVALNPETYALGIHCNKFITIVDTSNGKKAKALVRDTCPSCDVGSIDMSPALFERFESLDAGVISIKWSFD